MESYLEQVESLFLSTVRKGLSLRASDLEIVRDWERRGVPVDVVSRGIVGGIRKFLADAEPSTPVPAALKYYRTSVEREFEVHVRAAARGLASAAAAPTGGQAPAQTAVSLRDKARQILTCRMESSDGQVRELYAAAAARFEAASEGTPLADLLFQIEDMLVSGLGQTLDPARYAEIRASVEKDIEKAVSCGVGRRALEDLRRHGLRKAVAAAAGFDSFLDAVVCEFRK